MPGENDFSLQGISDMFGQGNIWQTDGFQPALQGFADAAGYSGSLFGDEYSYDQPFQNEGGDFSQQQSANSLNPSLLASLSKYGFKPTGAQSLGMFQGNNLVSNQDYGSKDSWFDKLAMAGIPMALTGGVGGGLASLFGGGMLGGAAGYGLANAGMADFQGGDASKAFLSGAIGGGLGAAGDFSPAKLAGIESPALGTAFNKGVGNFVGSVATGNSASDAAKSGLLSAGVSGLNSLGQNTMHPLFNAMQSYLSPGGDEFDSLLGSGGDMSGVTDVTPSSYEDTSPTYRYAGDQGGASYTPPTEKTASSVESPMSAMFSNLGNNALNYTMNHAGDLAQMLYGFYNNRRQQNALGSQINSLKGLYGQNSPYAQQLRSSLAAKAAAGGRRSNTGAREVQLQAALADRAAQMQPTLMQLNQAKGQLQNSMGSNMLSMLNRTGAFSGLANMFGSNNPFGNYSMSSNTGNYNILGGLEGLR